MSRVDITYPGDTITRSITALVRQPVSPTTAQPIDIGLVEISTPAEQIPGPIGPPGPGVVIHDAPPSDPVNGTLWWESDTGILWAWYVEPAPGGDSAQWVQISGGVGGPDTDLPITPQMFGAAGDGTTDDTAAFQAAAAAGVDLYIPAGLYKVTDMITIPTGRTWQGAGHTRSRIFARTAFNMAAAGIIKLGTTEPGANLYDVEIVCEQNTAETVRANMRQYPWAIVANVPRCQIDRVRISGAWNGVKMDGNAGGSWIGRIEIGALNVGLLLDGALDFVAMDSLHFGPFGFYGTATYTYVYADGLTKACELGFCESLAIGKLQTFLGVVEFINSTATIATRNIGILHLDGAHARLVHGGNNPTAIGQVYSTKSPSTTGSVVRGPDIEVSGGRLSVGYFHRLGSSPFPAIRETGGNLSLYGGLLAQSDLTQQFLLHSGGICEVRNCRLAPPGSARTVPYIESTGGYLTFKDNMVEGIAGSGPLVSIALDAYHDISGNSFNAFSFTPPAAAAPTLMYGCYGPNRVTKTNWTPTVTFAVPGDFAPTYDLQQGFIWWDTNGFRFDCRVQFDTNAFTTTSGQFQIQGLPVRTVGVNGGAMNVGIVSKVDYTAGYTQCCALISSVSGAIIVQQMGDNVAAIDLTITNIKPSTTDILFSVSGFVATK